LRFTIEIFDCESIEQNNYLFINIPIEKNERSEFEDFRDEEINEMVDKDAVILDEKLRRQLPNSNMNNSFLEKKVSNLSSFHFMDMISKSGEELKLSNDSLNSISKIHFQNNNLKNAGMSLPYNSEKQLINTDTQNKMSSIKNNNSSNSLLSKCLKFSEHKKVEKSKFKNNIILEKDKISLKNKEETNPKLRSLSSLKSLNVNKKVNSNDKSKNSEKKSKNSLSQKSNGIFTLINKNGKSKKIDLLDNNLSEMRDLTKNKKDDITVTFKEQSGVFSGYASSIKAAKLNNENLHSGTQNSTSLISGLVGKKNLSKVKSSLFVSEINGGDKEDKNKSLEKNGYILIELEKDKNNSALKIMNKNIAHKLFLHPIEEENEKKLQGTDKVSQNDNNNKHNNFSENKQNEKYIKTMMDNSINENESLFFKAIKESKVHLEKTRRKKLINFSQSSDQKSPINRHDSVGDSIEDSDYFFHSEEEECNCADLLVVDDEKFNVIASQRMLHNLGFESDAAYNGEECINLINNKIKSKCKCNRPYYKLIFLDIVMPVMDGIKAAKEIQSMIDKKILNEETKIVFISGNINDIKLKNSLLEIDCVKECLQKPVQISKYKMIIEKYYN
jgi:CheY-like chemotaxis protein